MSKTYIPKAVRARVAEQARYRCGYCLTPEFIVGYEMDIDHLIPEALGGQTSVGRATVEALQLNREPLVKSRQVWIAAGLPPPKD